MPDNFSNFDQSAAVYIQAQTYEIGCDDVPNASPVHNKRVPGFWIDAAPLSFAHFEVFVSAGGYFNPKWWGDSKFKGKNFFNGNTVDEHCSELFDKACEFTKRNRVSFASSVDCPLVGLTWMETAAVCRSYEARLPFEAEWEVAMLPGPSVRQPTLPRIWERFRFSRWGCKVTNGFLQEWTADPFEPKYWRVDQEECGKFYDPTRHKYGISIRGSSLSDIHEDRRFRRSCEPEDKSAFRGFRRVWGSAPTTNQLSVTFDCVNYE